MKKILFLFLLISTSGFTQNNVNGLWKIDEIIGLYSTNDCFPHSHGTFEKIDKMHIEKTKNALFDKFWFN